MDLARIGVSQASGISARPVQAGKTLQDQQLQDAINALLAYLAQGEDGSASAPPAAAPAGAQAGNAGGGGGGNRGGGAGGGQHGGSHAHRHHHHHHHAPGAAAAQQGSPASAKAMQNPRSRPAPQPLSAHAGNVGAAAAARSSVAGGSGIAGVPSVTGTTGITGTTGSSAPAGAALHLKGTSNAPGAVVAAPGSVYNYTPTAIQNPDGSKDIYWGAEEPGRPGDSIYTAHAAPGAGFGPPRVAFNSDGLSTGVGHGGNNVDTCDPSILDANGQRYLYVGIAGTSGQNTSIAAAVQGPDGSFHEMKLGSLVAQSANAHANNANDYGRGQPSVIHDGKYFYMAATDTNGRDGEGSYLYRSTGANFADGQTETLTSRGWEPLTAANNTGHALLHNDALDLAIDPATGDKLAITSGGNTSMLASWNGDFTASTRPSLVIPNNNVEQPGFLRSGSGALVGGLDDFTFYTATTMNHLQDGHPAPDTIRAVQVQTG